MKAFDYVLLGLVAILAVIGLFAPSQSSTSTVSEDSVVARVISILSDDLGGTVETQEKVFTQGFNVQDGTGSEVIVADTLGNLDVSNSLTYEEKTETISTDDTILASQSGTTFYIASGTTSTLPPVEAGLVFNFSVSGSIADTNFVIDSYEGDNMEGSLIVAGAVVDCAGEDQINFVNDGENVGDYVTVRSDGSQWLIFGNALTSAKLTCTDPS